MYQYRTWLRTVPLAARRGRLEPDAASGSSIAADSTGQHIGIARPGSRQHIRKTRCQHRPAPTHMSDTARQAHSEDKACSALSLSRVSFQFPNAREEDRASTSARKPVRRQPLARVGRQ
eukprot:637667-Rhodomonas_salina.1